MPKYAYKAVDKQGKQSFGVIDADSQALAINDIRNLGLFPTTVREATKSDEKKARRGERKISEFYIGGVKQKQIVIMTRQLSTLIEAGLPLLRSLNVLIGQMKPCKLKDILREVTSDVQSGATFSEALAKHPRAFDRLYVNMVRAGEVGGILEVVLDRLARYMERRQALKRRVRGALIYPIAVIIIATGIVGFLLTFVVPAFAEFFKELDTELPKMTAFLIAAGDYMQVNWWLLLVYISAILIGLKVLFKIPFVKRVFDRVILKVWLVGDLVTKVAVARFARTFGTLITSGVPILQSLRITKETIGNYSIQKAIQKVHDSIKEGDTIARPLDESRVFPSMVVNMIDVGEETGSLDSMLHKVADIYDAEVEAAVEVMLRMLEPMLIFFLGGVVGFIVISLYMPIIKLIDTLSNAT